MDYEENSTNINDTLSLFIILCRKNYFICVLFFVRTYINYKGGTPISATEHSGIANRIVTAIQHATPLHRLNIHVRQFTNEKKGRMN